MQGRGSQAKLFRTTSAIFILFLSFLPPTTFHCTKIVQNVYGSGQLTSETDLLCLTEYFCSRRWLPVSGNHWARAERLRKGKRASRALAKRGWALGALWKLCCAQESTDGLLEMVL